MGESEYTVGDLLGYLADEPRDRRIVLASDAEGNRHSPLAGAWGAMYVPDSTWSGDVYPTEEEIEADPRLDEDEDGAPEGAERVIVLGPVN